MRITGGRFRGRSLAAPEDERVRPTADKVRQAVFNILVHNDFGTGFAIEDARVADLFAGTGAMGLEALSHGARFCLFVDNSAGSRALLRGNVESFALTGVTKIWRRDATELGPMPPGAGGPFDLVFLDPPYRENLIAPALASLRDGRWLAPHALLVAEHALDETVASIESFSVVDSRTYGDTAVDFMLFEEVRRRVPPHPHREGG
jgi:16S rRNA (guanine966-N2)-methyltransferase